MAVLVFILLQERVFLENMVLVFFQLVQLLGFLEGLLIEDHGSCKVTAEVVAWFAVKLLRIFLAEHYRSILFHEPDDVVLAVLDLVMECPPVVDNVLSFAVFNRFQGVAWRKDFHPWLIQTYCNCHVLVTH